MKNQEFSLYESAERALSRWWLMVLLMIIGGIAGWLFHLFYPPVYEAEAAITINMDFEQRQLTQYEEDAAFNAAGAIITSSNVKNLVIKEAQVNGYSLNQSQIKEHFFLEGKQSVWILRVRDQNPKIAEELSNIWAENATSAMNMALSHALQAEQLQVQIDGLDNCLAGTLKPDAAEQLNCKGLAQEELQVMVQGRTEDLVHEKSASLGMIPIMAVAWTESASVPEKPVLYGQASLVIAGAFIGLVVSLWLTNVLKVSPHD
jgi:hypothetical protein